MKKAFTLIEMLVVIGIIAVLIGALVGSYSHMTKAAEKAQYQELVNNTATALTALFQQEGAWPKRLRNATPADGGGKLLDERAAYPLAKGGYLSLTTDGDKLAGYDRFGVVSPVAMRLIKSRGTHVKKADVQQDILRFEIDLDGDGIIPSVTVNGQTISVRATAIVWCGGVYSWTYGQTQNVD